MKSGLWRRGWKPLRRWPGRPRRVGDRDYERLLALRPEATDVMAAIIPLYESSGRTEAHERLSSRLGEIYLREGMTVEALALLADFSRRNPHDMASWERLAALCEKMGRIGEAVAAYRHLSEIHRAQRRLDPARKCLEAALALKPGDREMLETLGDLCLALSRRPEGVAWLGRAVAAMREGGEHERARDLALRILKLDPLNLGVRRMLAEALEATGARAAAIEEYMHAARGYAEVYQNEPALGDAEPSAGIGTQPDRRARTLRQAPATRKTDG